jgi:hypothetical protein
MVEKEQLKLTNKRIFATKNEAGGVENINREMRQEIYFNLRYAAARGTTRHCGSVDYNRILGILVEGRRSR